MPFRYRLRNLGLAAVAILGLIGGAEYWRGARAPMALFQPAPAGKPFVAAPAATPTYTDAAGAKWVDDNGAVTTGSCPEATGAAACTLTYALSSVSAGGTIILNSGTYSGDLVLDAANHQNVTVTAPASVKNALTWTCGSSWIPDCGVVSGTDNRPYFSAGTVDISQQGVTVDHLRVRMGASGTNGFCFVVTINSLRTTISRMEIWNGCNGIGGYGVTKGIVVKYSYLHAFGGSPFPTCGGQDHHGIGIYNFSDMTAASGFGSADSAPTTTSGIVISHNTITGAEGDGMQELGQYDAPSIPSQYLLQEYNHVYDNCEQGLDYKGTRNVIIRNNDVHGNIYGGVSTNDSDGATNYQHLDWWIYNNIFHDQENFGLYSQENDDGRWYIWNNIFYQNCTNPQYNWSALSQPPPNSRVENNVFWNNNRTAGNAAGGLTSDAGGSSVLVKNNIFYNNGTGSTGNIYSGSDATITTNYCYPTSPGICGSNAITSSSPGFVNIASAPYDFSLAVGSVNLNAGLTLTGANATHTITIDRVGISRPQGAAWDLGAFEKVP